MKNICKVKNTVLQMEKLIALNAFVTYNSDNIILKDEIKWFQLKAVRKMELINISGNTFYIPGKTNIGLVKYGDGVVLIDSGNDKEAGRKLRQLLDSEGLKVKYILNTHSNADHIGANAYLMNQYNCDSYSYGLEVIFSKHPELESSFLYGGFPTSNMKNKFLMAKACQMKDISELETDIEYFKIDGHFHDMVAYKTLDNVYFLGDSLFPKDIIEKYHLFYILDVKSYLETLTILEKLNDEGDAYFVPSHGVLSTNIKEVIDLNRNKILEVIELIKTLASNKISFDQLFKAILDKYKITLDLNQYLLVGSTIRNYLSYLYEQGKIGFVFEDNILYYLKKD